MFRRSQHDPDPRHFSICQFVPVFIGRIIACDSTCSLRLPRANGCSTAPRAIRGIRDAPQSLLACYSALPDRSPPWAQIHSSQFPLFPLLEAQQRSAQRVSASQTSRRAKSFWIWIDLNCARTGMRSALAGAMTANPRIL